MKRHRRKETAEKRQRRVEFAHEFFMAVTRPGGRAVPCLACSRLSAIQAHHVVDKDYIRRRVSKDPAVVYDPRNGMPVCRRCHEKHTLAVKRLSIRLIPFPAWEFAREHNVEHRIEAHYDPAD